MAYMECLGWGGWERSGTTTATSKEWEVTVASDDRHHVQPDPVAAHEKRGYDMMSDSA